VSDGIEAGALTEIVLERIGPNDDGVRVRGGGDHIAVENKYACKIAPIDDVHGQVDNARQRFGHVAGSEEDLRRVSHTVGKF
jgi:hypothetical protein